MREDTYTEDFADIISCARERRMVMEILQEWQAHGLPDDFSGVGSGVKFAFNRNSGNVFLVNDEYQVAMLNGGKLESFYTSPYAGREGFFEELALEYADMHEDDQEWMREIANGREIPNAGS